LNLTGASALVSEENGCSIRLKRLRFAGPGEGSAGASDGEGAGATGRTSAGTGEAAVSGTGGGVSSCAHPWATVKETASSKVRPHFMSRLNSKRCKSCQTLYQSAMKSLCASAILILIALPPAEGKSRHCMFRVHAEANAQDTEVFATAVRAVVSGKQVAIQKGASINENDVVAFSAYQVGDGNFGALIQLDDHGRITLDSLSVEHRGGYLFIFMNGRAITELQIDKRVSDGKIYIPSGLTAADVQSMKKDWRLIGPKSKSGH
jgi:hypothetical protein